MVGGTGVHGVGKGGGTTTTGSSAGLGGGPGSASSTDRLPPHKRGHSLAGGLGKFASGIARAGSSKDRDKGKK
jgi:hypothetical protein